MKPIVLKTLLSNLIDYAGTFPPAQLSLEKAIEEASLHSQAMKCPWLYSKMALPFSEIKKVKVSDIHKFSPTHFVWYWAALSSVPFEEVAWELREIIKWNEKHAFGSYYQKIVAYEVKVEEERLGELLNQLNMLKDTPLTLFFEVPPKGNFEKILPALEKAKKGLMTFGLKIRTGGKEVPDPAVVANFIQHTVSGGLLFKATQGLHETISHGKDFGFLNLFAALNFAQVYGPEEFSAKTLTELLVDSSAKSFSFEGDKFKWKEYTLTIEQIEHARRIHGGCFGSCSLQEPDQSLHKIF